jgi:hypothetical protein
MRLALTTGLALFLFASVAAAQSPRPAPGAPRQMTTLDFHVDGSQLTGKRVTLMDCQFFGTNGSWVSCSSRENGSIFVMVEAKSLDREDYRRALRQCAGMRDTDIRCQGTVTGTVFQFIGANLRNAKIDWAAP